MRRLGVAVGLVLVGVAVALFFLYSQTDVERQLKRGEWVRVLVVGVDSGAQGEPQGDYVAVYGVSPDGRGAVLTVPAELALPVETEASDETSWVRLADLWTREGSTGLSKRLAELLEVRLDYVVEVDFGLFKQVVDMVNGVTVEIPTRISYVDEREELYIDIHAGTQTLEGEDALHLVRYRTRELDVEGRAERSELFLRAFWQRLRELSWAEWRDLARMIREATTDLSFWEALDLARALRDLEPEAVRFSLLPYAVTRGQVRADIVGVRQLTRGLFEDEAWLARASVRIHVLNGTGEDLAASAASAGLEDLGFRIAGRGRADRTDYDRSVLLYRPDAEEHAGAVARFLPEDTLVMNLEEWEPSPPGELPDDADLLLVVGRGFELGRR